MIKDKHITASIVLYNSDKDEIRRLAATLSAKGVVTFLVDNSPEPVFSEEDFASDDAIRYFFLNENLGYGRAHNIGFEKSEELGGDYHIVVNPDILMEETDLEVLVDYMEKNQDVGQVMPKILYPDGDIQHLCKLLPSPVDLIMRRFIPFKGIKKDMANRYELRFADYHKEMEVPNLSGCFMFLRMSAVKKVGGFDKRYFMYLEDTDLTRRIGEFYKTVYYPNVSVVHEYDKGSYKNPKLLQYHIDSAIKYFNKWGWLFDKNRKVKNKETLTRLSYPR